MRFLGKKKASEAIARAPGMYAGEDPNAFVFDNQTRGRLETNHWKLATLIVGIIATGAVWTREPAPSEVTVVGVSADVQGKPIVRTLSKYQPDDQAIRWSAGDLVSRMFTIEPILTLQVSDSRLKLNINSVRGQMQGSAHDQFKTWLNDDAPFERITANPKLIREVKLGTASLLPDSTVAIELATTTLESFGAKPVVEHYTMTLRYQIGTPTPEDAVSPNPFGFYCVYFTVQKTAA